MRRVGQFEVFVAKSGVPSVKHIPSGVLVHSAFDPLREASEIAKRLLNAPGDTIIVIGSGLGYLSNALSEGGKHARSVEVFPELDVLARQCITDRRDLRAVRNDKSVSEGAGQVYIAPYVLALCDLLSEDARRGVNELRVRAASQSKYRPLIAANEAVNAEPLATIRHLKLGECTSAKPVVIVGAGPSLNWCLPAISRFRSDLIIVAASGAVPSLWKSALIPDWTIALEAQATVAQDLECLPDGARVVVFPWTNPDVLSAKRWSIAIAGTDFALNTGGGTTALTAADFAAKISCGHLFLVGMDLSNSSGHYALGALRENASGLAIAPKYDIMRDRFESWLISLAPRVVNHVLPADGIGLMGARHIMPHEFGELLGKSVTDIRETELV